MLSAVSSAIYLAQNLLLSLQPGIFMPKIVHPISHNIYTYIIINPLRLSLMWKYYPLQMVLFWRVILHRIVSLVMCTNSCFEF